MEVTNISGFIMDKDRKVVEIKNDKIVFIDQKFAPLHFVYGKSIETWLKERAIDSSRTNARLLKKVLRLKEKDDISTVLSVNATTLTDNYWFKSYKDDESLCWENVKITKNDFDGLALKGDLNDFNKKPSRSPELTNIGSFEKCWKNEDGNWYLYKTGNELEYFSECFIYQLGKRLKFYMAEYDLKDGYIRSKDFTEHAKYNFEPMATVIEDNDDYNDNFNFLSKINENLAKQYLKIIYLDSVVLNVDRHTFNYGFLRDDETGEIVSLAPNFDNNIALISRGYPENIERENDGFIKFFTEFINSNEVAKKMFKELDIPLITEEMLEACFEEVPIKVNEEIIKNFILNGQRQIKKAIIK